MTLKSSMPPTRMLKFVRSSVILDDAESFRSSESSSSIVPRMSVIIRNFRNEPTIKWVI